MFKQEMTRVNIDILGITEIKWTRMGKFKLHDHYIYCSGEESLRKNGVIFIVNKTDQNAEPGCNLQNDRIIFFCFQSKPFNITVILVYAPTSNAKEAEVERFYDDLHDLLDLTPKIIIIIIISLFHHRGLECQSRTSRDTWSNQQVWP